MADGRLQERVTLITGSDSGIGQATAEEFAKEGADVVVHFLDDSAGTQTTRRAVEAAGRSALVGQGDISDETAVEEMFDQAVDAFGTIDILMSNAGVDALGTEVTELSTEMWDKAIRTNLYGALFCC